MARVQKPRPPLTSMKSECACGLRPSCDSDQCTTGRTPGGHVAIAAYTASFSVRPPGQNFWWWKSKTCKAMQPSRCSPQYNHCRSHVQCRCNTSSTELHSFCITLHHASSMHAYACTPVGQRESSARALTRGMPVSLDRGSRSVMEYELAMSSFSIVSRARHPALSLL